MKNFHRLFIALLLCTGFSSAQESGKSKWAVYPFPFWSPETKWGGGAVASFSFFPAVNDSVPTTVAFYGLYTVKNQLEIEASFDHWRNIDRDRYFLKTDYRYFPNFFYGIGNDLPDSTEDYTPRSYGAEAGYQHKLGRNLYAGGQVEWLYYDVIKTEAGRKLDNGVPGTGKGAVVSVGLNAKYDSRDNSNFPRNGSFQSVKIQPYPTFLGSRYGFINILSDHRWYFPLFARQAIAYQLVTHFGFGTVPFYKMGLLGGNYTMRGYWEGRYRDRNMVAMQAEYRFPIYWKFSGAVFGGFGDVAHNVSDFRPADFKPSVGYGLRFNFGTTSLRLDIGYGKNSVALAAGIGEAF